METKLTREEKNILRNAGIKKKDLEDQKINTVISDVFIKVRL